MRSPPAENNMHADHKETPLAGYVVQANPNSEGKKSWENAYSDKRWEAIVNEDHFCDADSRKRLFNFIDQSNTVDIQVNSTENQKKGIQ